MGIVSAMFAFLFISFFTLTVVFMVSVRVSEFVKEDTSDRVMMIASLLLALEFLWPRISADFGG